MSSTLLAELEAELARAKRVRNGARRRVDAVRSNLPNLTQQVVDSEEGIRDLQWNHDVLDSHVLKLARKGKRSEKAKAKMRKKVARRDRRGAEARSARLERADLRAEIRTIEIQREALKNQLSLPRLNEDYVIARHRVLEEIARIESRDPERQARIQELIKLAKIPDEWCNDPTSVWHYSERDETGDIREIHFFYGGREAPDYDGLSPDGVGHGHHILTIDGDGTLRLSYHRLPV